MSYAIQIPYTDTTLVVNCKCGTATILTWMRQVIKGCDHDQAADRNIHGRMRPATHAGTVYGKTLFVVRNPVHRFVSCYFDKMSDPKCRRYYRKGLTIQQWAKDLTNERYRHTNEHWRPQSTMLKMIHDQDLMTVVDLYDLQQHLDHLLAQVGCPSPKLINSKSSKKRYEGKPEQHTSRGILQHLQHSYAEDFKLYERARKAKAPARSE